MSRSLGVRPVTKQNHKIPSKEEVPNFFLTKIEKNPCKDGGAISLFWVPLWTSPCAPAARWQRPHPTQFNPKKKGNKTCISKKNTHQPNQKPSPTRFPYHFPHFSLTCFPCFPSIWDRKHSSRSVTWRLFPRTRDSQISTSGVFCFSHQTSGLGPVGSGRKSRFLKGSGWINVNLQSYIKVDNIKLHQGW